ncbi:MAG: hypothetical protein ACPG6V_12385 [Flavobacteriales bacterium]
MIRIVDTMKKQNILTLLFWTIIAFIGITLMTGIFELQSDGVSKLGYPWVFYDYFSGKCDDCYLEFGFKPGIFIIDFGLLFLIVYIIMLLRNQMKAR